MVRAAPAELEAAASPVDTAANLVAADQAEVAADPVVLVVVDQVAQDRAELDPVEQDQAALAAAITEPADRRRARLADQVDFALVNQVD